jgi:cell division protein ZapA (FtsZ GTPase activity inhibitor)
LSPAIRAKADSGAIELLNTAFIMCWPEVKDIGELDKGERAQWTLIREGLVHGGREAREAMKTVVGIFDKYMAVEIKGRQEGVKLEKQTQLQSLRIQLEEHEQQKAHREARHKNHLKKEENEILKERMLMAMTAVSFLSVVICFAIASLTGHILAYGGTGLFSLLSAGGAARLFIFNKADADGQSDEDRDSGDAPQRN